MLQNDPRPAANSRHKRHLRADITAVLIAVVGLLLTAFRVIGPAALIAFFGVAVFIEKTHTPVE